MVKNPPVNAGEAGDTGDMDLILRLGRSPGGGNGNPLQYSGLENPMDRGAWWAIVHLVAKSWTRLNDGTNIHKLIYSVVLVSDVQQSDSVICIHIYPHIFFLMFFSIIINYKIMNIVPCATQWDLVFYFIHSSLYLLNSSS